MRPSRSSSRTRAPRPEPLITTPEAERPGGSTPFWASPGASPPRTTARALPDDRRRDEAGAAGRRDHDRILRDDRLEVAAWAGLDRRLGRPLPVLRRDEGWSARSCARAASWPSPTSAPTASRPERYDGVLDFAGHLVAPLVHGDRVIGALSAVTREPRTWTSGDVAFISTLATHAAIALTNAELFEQTDARAGQLEVLQAASARMSRASTFEEVGRTDRRGDPPDHRLPQRPGLPRRAARRRRADRVRGPRRRLRAGRHGAPRCRLGEGFTGWVAQHGEPILVNDANRDPRGATIAGHRRRRRVDAGRARCATTSVTIGVITLSKLGLDGFDADDLRLLTILADQAATAVGVGPAADPDPGPRRRAAPAAGHERRAVGQPRSAPGRRPDRRPPGPRRWASSECVISYWDRTAGRVESLGYFPAHRLREIEPFLRRRRLPRDPPRPRAPGRRSSSTSTTRRPTRPRSRSCVSDGNTRAGDAAARRQGPVDRPGRARVRRPRHVRRRAPRAGPDDGQRGGHGARERPAVRGRPQARRPRSADRLLQPPVPARAPRRGGRPGPARDAGR